MFQSSLHFRSGDFLSADLEAYSIWHRLMGICKFEKVQQSRVVSTHRSRKGLNNEGDAELQICFYWHVPGILQVWSWQVAKACDTTMLQNCVCATSARWSALYSGTKPVCSHCCKRAYTYVHVAVGAVQCQVVWALQCYKACVSKVLQKCMSLCCCSRSRTVPGATSARWSATTGWSSSGPYTNPRYSKNHGRPGTG